MSLYRIVEVPDPSGQLADMIEELLDNSALVEVNLNMEEAQLEVDQMLDAFGVPWSISAHPIVAAALNPQEEE